jgi:ATP-dependent Clp protease ATP-binding subunit ClpA
MLKDINIKLQEQGVQVALTPDAISWIVSQGYDERLGARPLRRMMQKTVESAVSDVLLSGNVSHGSTINLNAEILSKALGK